MCSSVSTPPLVPLLHPSRQDGVPARLERELACTLRSAKKTLDLQSRGEPGQGAVVARSRGVGGSDLARGAFGSSGTNARRALALGPTVISEGQWGFHTLHTGVDLRILGLREKGVHSDSLNYES